jgi:hypothetical protein
MKIGYLTPCILVLDTRLICVDSYSFRLLYCTFFRLDITTASLEGVNKKVSLCPRWKLRPIIRLSMPWPTICID